MLLVTREGKERGTTGEGKNDAGCVVRANDQGK